MIDPAMKPTSTMQYTPEELRDIAAGIASKLGIEVGDIKVSQADDDLLTVEVSGRSFTGTLTEIWKWIERLANDLNASSGFGF